MPAKKTDFNRSVYQLKVTLRHSKPPVWRRLLVTGDTTLEELHRILQIAMGWTDSHLHLFDFGEQRYSDPEFELEDASDESKVRLQKAASPKMKFSYEYDFGDGWEHEILMEKELAPEEGAHYPQCVAGKRACPPEDCGGIWGYERFLEVINDEDDPEHEDMLEWIGEEFDAEAFDLEEVNRDLRRFA